jgi:Transposase DDE domain
MEHQLWKAIVALLSELDKPPTPAVCDFSDELIVRVWYWAVIHDRPVSWACRRVNWPPALRRGPRPSDATMSRRLRSAPVRALLAQLERRVIRPTEPGLFWMIDGKPLPIGGCSKDKQAGYGRAAGGKAKGYKLHALIGGNGAVAAWRVAPMNTDERVMAERLVKSAPAEVHGYVVADGNYDSNKLHAVCDQRGQLQLLTRRRYGSDKGTGHRRQSRGRLRSMARVENPFPAFADGLLADRSEIERRYGHLSNWGGGLNGLPAWVRTHRRVSRWVQAKLVLTARKRQNITRTYVD